MDKYLGNLQELASLALGQRWNTPLFWIVFAIALFVLFFAAGTIARIIFGLTTGLFKAFLALLLVVVAGVAAAGASLTWISDSSTPTAAALGVAAALAVLFIVKPLIGNKYGPAVGIAVLALAATGFATFGSSKLATVIAEKLEKVEDKTRGDFQSVK